MTAKTYSAATFSVSSRANLGANGAGDEVRTRHRVFSAITDHGPVTASHLAKLLGLTPAAIRRHLDALQDSGHTEIREFSGPKAGRGRPARHYVVSSDGHDRLENVYDTVAIDALKFAAELGGPGAVRAFAKAHMDRLEASVAPAVEAAGPDIASRSRALAQALTREGFAASATPVAAGTPMEAMQLCQGHCPIRSIAGEFDEFCDVELESFSQLLGVDVRRLSTLANNDHVCTTHVPTSTLNRSLEGLSTREATTAKENSGD